MASVHLASGVLLTPVDLARGALHSADTTAWSLKADSVMCTRLGAYTQRFSLVTLHQYYKVVHLDFYIIKATSMYIPIRI